MNQRGFKILIVDDSLFNQELLRIVLSAENEVASATGQTPYIIEFAKSGTEALEKVSVFKPDLILLDIIMPGMDGFEVLARLKECEVTQAIPVIIITGLSDEENEEKGFSSGAVDYITRPFHKSVVLARIKTHQKIVEQMRIIELHSFVDPLTNIPNRRSFDFRIEEVWGIAMRHKDPVSFLMIDIDNFKSFNDTYGHQQGDIALKAVAGTIVGALKRSSDMAFRWGGEEFTAILMDTSIEGALLVAERIRTGVENTLIPDINGDNPKTVTVSIGVASEIPEYGGKIANLIRRADVAMYVAKESGRNKVSSAREETVPDEV